MRFTNTSCMADGCREPSRTSGQSLRRITSWRSNPGNGGREAAALSEQDEAASAMLLRRFRSKSSLERMQEADEFYDAVIAARIDDEAKKVARQGYAGLLWSKQFYHYVIRDWLVGDPAQPRLRRSDTSAATATGRISSTATSSRCPTSGNIPWFAAWDLAFHMIPFSKIDPHFAKKQLILFLREWYMHPNGQIPAYEFAFGDVNPPVHAWAAGASTR